ncbi:MAG: GNAT family N-acetyltransferase [Bacteroidota bacterium]
MQRLLSAKFDPATFNLENQPENCSLLFLLQQEKSAVLVDMASDPTLLAVTYPEAPPSSWFLAGDPKRRLIFRNFLRSLTQPTDLIIPKAFFHQIDRYWNVQFSVPILFLAAEPNWHPQPSLDFRVRLINPDEANQLKNSFAESSWLWEFFGNPEALLKKGQATAAFINGKMACVATTLAFTKNYCELGVATLPEFRGKGLALECCRALSHAQFKSFGRLPCWRTNTANVGSWKTARNLGLKETPGSEEYLFISNYRHIGAYATVAP